MAGIERRKAAVAALSAATSAALVATALFCATSGLPCVLAGGASSAGAARRGRFGRSHPARRGGGRRRASSVLAPCMGEAGGVDAAGFLGALARVLLLLGFVRDPFPVYGQDALLGGSLLFARRRFHRSRGMGCRGRGRGRARRKCGERRPGLAIRSNR